MSNNPYGYGSGMSASFSSSQATAKPAAQQPATSGAAAAPSPNFSPAASAPAETGPLIKDTTTQDFVADVVEASKHTTVLVDFWAPWCGPCKQLMPILEKAVNDAKGRVKLVKLNIDDHPAIPGQMGIQSVPAVLAFKDGRPIDGFMGAQQESQIRAFIDKNGSEPAADPLDQATEQAIELLEAGDAAQALQIFGAILQQQPDHVPAIAGLCKSFLALDEIERARGVFDTLPQESLKEQAITALKASLELAEQSADLGEVGELEAKLAENPGDNQIQFDLAIALNGKNKREEATDHLIAIIKRDRDWNEDGARKQLLQFFESWGVMDPASIYGRRQLSSILFS
ncbi:MAG: thioredoxin [Cohaesibacter sp.]|nr:thioredoxin [Cohaesibacter sp.]